MEAIISKVNLAWAAVITVLTAVFGVHWYLFAGFLALNVLDYGTGIWKAKKTNTENSSKGAEGAKKKVSYWITIAISFFIAYVFKDLGKEIGVDLGFSDLIGWFVLATFIINEIRSVLENIVEAGGYVPAWLIKGLEVANDKINQAAGGEDE